MKIAVLLYGQPRFFEHTWKYLQEEFSLPGHQFDFFVHFWRGVGFSPKDDKQLNYIDNTSQVKARLNELNCKKITIEGYDKLDILSNSFSTVHKFLIKNKIQQITDPLHYRYFLGQYFSVYSAYCLMEQYEKEHNIEYDVIVKARSDFIYKDKRFYTESKYISVKEENYINDFESYKDVKFAKTIDIIHKRWFLDYDPPQWSSCKKFDFFDKNNTSFVRDKYNILRMGDINIATNRKAARCFFYYFFHVNFCTLANDVYDHTLEEIKTGVPEGLIFKRHDAMFGDIALGFDIKLKLIKKCRYIRVVYLHSCKDTWLRDNHGAIVVSDLNSDISTLIEHKLNEKSGV